MESQPLISFLIITMNRFGDLKECVKSILKQDYDNIEIIIVDNNSRKGGFKRFKNQCSGYDCIKLIRSKWNRGVSGGRNLGLKNTSGDIVVTIDDDAILKSPRTTSLIKNRFRHSEGVGVLAFKITNYYSRQVRDQYFPHKNKSRPKNEEFETSRFIGAGHAIKSEVYDTVGAYRDYYPYGHEEIDLSLRILDAGYKIIYFPDAEIFHKELPNEGLFSDSSRFHANMLSKRIQVAVQNLPLRYVFTTALVRSLTRLYKSGFNIYSLLLAYYDLYSRWGSIIKNRKVLSKETLSKIIELRGPVIY